MSEIKKNIEHGVDKTFIRYVCQGSMAGAISTLTKNATKSVINPMLDVFFNFTHEKKGRRKILIFEKKGRSLQLLSLLFLSKFLGVTVI